MHAHKRRRLDSAASALTKPFRSPLHKPLAERDPNAPSPLSRRSACQSIDENASPGKIDPKVKRRLEQAVDPNAGNLRPQNRHVEVEASCAYVHENAQDQQRQLTMLLNRLQAMRARLDISQQALRIERSQKSVEELESSIQAWRLAARAAAEEVFSSVQDRVNRMGGIRGLHEKEQQIKQRRQEWEQEEREAERERRQQEREQMRADRLELRATQAETASDDHEDYAVDGAEEPVDEQTTEPIPDTSSDQPVDEEAGYTIGMMLSSLNIDHTIIGYNKDFARWED